MMENSSGCFVGGVVEAQKEKLCKKKPIEIKKKETKTSIEMWVYL